MGRERPILRPPPSLKTLSVAVVALGLTLGIVELGLRLVVGTSERAREVRSMLERSKAATPEPGVVNVSLRGLIQPSSNDRMVYELKPGLRATFIGVPVAINQAGFRERERSRAKPPATFRIAGLGDSTLFGWGVPVEATFLRVLEALLEERRDPVRYETLNFGVPGYNAVMEMETLRTVARHYQPDLLVISPAANDTDIPNFMKQSALRWPSNLYLYNLVVHGWRVMQNRAWELMPARVDRAQGRMVAVGEVPEAYRETIGRDAVRRAYDDLAAMAATLGAPVLVIGDYPRILDPSQVAELRTRGRFVFVEVSDAYADHARRTGRPLQIDDVTLGPHDRHPSALGHRILAEAAYRAMVAHDLLPSVRAR